MSRPVPGGRPPVPRGRPAERGDRDRRPPAPGDRGPRAAQPQRRPQGATGSRQRQAPAVRPAGPQLPGALAVLGVFLLTLVGAAADSWVAVGLGTITTVALVAGTVVATLVTRRRDVGTVVVAPPLVFLGVALANIVAAPSATFSAATIATLLIRGFPAMAIASAAALVLLVFRLITRR